jgi:predicted nucleotidyltransferase
MKTLKEIKAELETLKPSLKERFEVETIGVFGSYTRGEQTKKSDIDILVTLSKDAHVGLFEFMDLEEFLTKKLGVKVDLGTKASLKPHIGKRILEEVIMV